MPPWLFYLLLNSLSAAGQSLPYRESRYQDDYNHWLDQMAGLNPAERAKQLEIYADETGTTPGWLLKNYEAATGKMPWAEGPHPEDE